MPSQAMITHMTKAEVQQKITELKATELLMITEIDSVMVVAAQMNGIRQKAGAQDALQRLADEDSRRTRIAEAKLAEADAAEQKAAKAKAKAAKKAAKVAKAKARATKKAAEADEDDEDE